MVAPVGKSGAGMYSIKSSMDRLSSASKALQASITSLRLCGGILVAMPTAMPEEPLTSKVGILAGSTKGSCSEPS